VHARVWRLTVGRVFLYLLDTDSPENDEADRPITSQLYVRGREMRLCQEWLLGIGGVRALRELHIEPAVWHMNEGHSAFQVMERIREYMADGMPWKEAVETTRRNTLFTTHTPVPAGNESFDAPLVDKYVSVLAEKMGVSHDQLMDLGRSYPERGSQPFNLTAVGVRLSSYSNGVSKLHGEVANQMWKHLLPEVGEEEQPIQAITNGVHVSTWLGHDIRMLLEEHFGLDWNTKVFDRAAWDKVKEIPDEEVWSAHQNQKDRLMRLIRHRLVAQFGRHGKSPDEMREVAHMLDSSVLTIGFARRFATYKRARLIFQDYNRLKEIIANADRPVQIVFSGKAHPADQGGQELVRQIVETAFYSDLKGHIFFVEDYDMRIARHLVQGVDIWLNTPRRPREASGTSGMKAGMNGAMNFSIADGWWPEGYNGRNGWVIGGGQQFDNEEMQDYEDSSSFYEIMEKEIVPLYYSNRKNGIPTEWVQWMKESMASVIPSFSAVRMLEEYVNNAYMPLAQQDES
jgi:starch phosphorylase